MSPAARQPRRPASAERVLLRLERLVRAARSAARLPFAVVRLVMGCGVLMAGCTAQPHGSSTEPPSAPAGPCGSPVSTGALPAWARAGFNDDGSGIPHVAGRSGDILAIVFGSPLSAPPSADHNNKILWVSKAPLTGGDLKISASLDGTGETAERAVTGGPGPSTVDLPKAGCWRLTLNWSGHTDTMDLTYTTPASAGT